MGNSGTKMKILVCGATGFLGRNVAAALSKLPEYEVTGTYFQTKPPTDTAVNYVYADLRERDTVDQLLKGKDIVLHYAAIATNFADVLKRPHIHTTDNIIMNSLLFRYAHEHKVGHFVFPSCGYLYNAGGPFTEDQLDYNNLPTSYMASACPSGLRRKSQRAPIPGTRTWVSLYSRPRPSKWPSRLY